MSAQVEALVFAHRPLILIAFALLTLALGVSAGRLQVDAGFEKQLPLAHPYMQTLLDHQAEFGGADRLLVAVRARDGDMFDPHFFRTLKAVTEAVFFLPGVDRSSVRSIFTPNVRFGEIVEGGFAGGNVVAADFAPTPENIAKVRTNILKAGIVGRLVANDFSAAIVSAELIERDPAAGERLDYLDVAQRLEEQIRQPFTDDQVDIHILGFAKAMGDIAAGARNVIGFFALTFILTALLIYFFTHSVQLTTLPLACSLVAVVWTLGLLPLLGFGLDPLSILLPFLIFAIGVSHGVQMISAAGAKVSAGADGLFAARHAFRRLLLPGGVALASDVIGFLTILLIEIRLVQELAVTAALGIGVIILTDLLLLPVLLSYVRYDQRYRQRLFRSAAYREPLWRGLARFARPGPALATCAGAVILLVLGLAAARDLRTGDLRAGVPELRPSARYNQDARFVTEHFAVGVDVLQVIVETVPDGCVEHDVMAEIDRFAWHLENVPGVRSTLSLPQLAKTINAGWHEGNPKWRVLPRDRQSLAQSITPIETSTGLLNADCSVMPVLIFTADHKADTIRRVVEAAEAYAAANSNPRHVFRLASGNVGLMAATNDVVEAARVPMLLWIYAAVAGLCLATFRSLRAGFCILLPLGLVSVLVYGLMAVLGIGLKPSTLQVAVLGVGIGIDYGIYVFARLQALLQGGLPLPEAYLATLRVSGSAVLLTGLTLALGVGAWVFSPLQFQADMGLLLAFVFLANMLGALMLLPALASLVFVLLPWNGAR